MTGRVRLISVAGLCACVVGVMGAATAAKAYDAEYVFGDSLSDNGNAAELGGAAYPYPPSFEAYARPRIKPIPAPRSGADAPQSAVGGGPASQGVWIEFGGKRWTPTGPGPEPGLNFRLIGSYFDLPVYQERARVDRIFVPSKAGGPLIQYDLRP